VKSSHAASWVSASFSDPNPIASAGLVALMRSAERCDLPALIRRHVDLGVTTGVNPAGKAMTPVEGMRVGADGIEDVDALHTGATHRLSGEIYAPCRLGGFPRSFTHGHVRQPQAASRRLTANLIPHAGLIPLGEPIVYLDIDSKVKQVHGPAQQGAPFGYTKVRGLHLQIVTASTASWRPVVIATRPRKGVAGSGKGAHSPVAEAIRALREAGAGATVPVRADSAFLSAKLGTAIRAAGACYPITVADTKTIRAQVATIPETAWTPIKYRNPVRDADEGRQISEAEIAEIPYTAFTSKKAEPHTRARPIVRRVRRLNPTTVPDGRGELFAAHRHHAFHTTNPPVIDQTEPIHRQHAAIELAFSDLQDGPLAHPPPGKLHANPARPAPAALAYNPTRAAGTPAPRFHANATGATTHPHDPGQHPDRDRFPRPANPAAPARAPAPERPLHHPVDKDRPPPGTPLNQKKPARTTTTRTQENPDRTATRRPPPPATPRTPRNKLSRPVNPHTDTSPVDPGSGAPRTREVVTWFPGAPWR
jgi:hypothetical protein